MSSNVDAEARAAEAKAAAILNIPRTVRIDWTAPAPAREWLIPEWLPASRVCLLSGPGAVGKSRLALQLAVAVASGVRVWLKSGPPLTLPGGRAGGAVIASWEDEPDELGERKTSPTNSPVGWRDTSRSPIPLTGCRPWTCPEAAPCGRPRPRERRRRGRAGGNG